MKDRAHLPFVPRHRTYVLAACMLATFMAAIEATIVATAMPTIVGRLGGFALLGWVFAVYLMGQAVTIPIYGRLGDLYGRRRVFFAGAVLFLVGSALCGFASSMLALVIFRGLQGLGAGSILPISTTIVADIYAPEERAAVQGYLGGVWGISAIAGPFLGALIVQYLPWSFIFWLNLPVGASAIALLFLYFRESPRHTTPQLDVMGAALLGAAVLSLLIALLETHLLGPWAIALGAVSAILLRLLVRQERRAREPLLPPVLWQNPTIVAGAAGSLTIGAAMMATSAFLPTYVQGVMGRRALDAGATLALMSLAWPLASVLAARLMRQTSYRATAIAGGVALLGGSVMLAALGQSGGGLLWPCLSASLVGVGMGICYTTFLVSVQNSAGQHVRGIATAMTNFTRMLGAAIGTACLGAVLNMALSRSLPGVEDPMQALMDPTRRAGLAPADLAYLTARTASAMRTVFWAACVFGAAAIAAGWRVPRNSRPGSEAARQGGAAGSSSRDAAGNDPRR